MSIRNFQNLRQAKRDFVTVASIVVVVIFFVSTSYVTFIVDNPTRDREIILYYQVGLQTLYGDRESVYLASVPIGWSILLASTDSIINDVYVTAKLFSVFFATAILVLSFFIIKNIFGRKTALLAQTIIAITPFFHVEAILTHNEMVPVFLICLSFYFITKKQLSKRDLILCGVFLGLATMIRYQAALIAISCIPLFLIQYKKIRLSKIILFSLFFIIACSPLLIYNYLTFGTLIENDPSLYLSNYSNIADTTALENTFVERTQSVGSTTFFEINQSFTKNYFYNLFVANPNKVFHITHDIQNWSPIPLIQYVGIPIILGGAIVAFNRHIEKKEIIFLTIVSLIILAFLIAIDYAEYFFMCIIVPVLILGIRSIKKIECFTITCNSCLFFYNDVYHTNSESV